MKEPTERHTDKKMLVKGLKLMGLTLLLIVATSYLLTFSFLNKEVLPLYVILPLAIIGMAFTLWVGFKGLRTIIQAVFGQK
tara:strand:+ start:56 stop:298 length:243 start_codon:yes stop_codon:yes gene_type:complete